nr:MAG: hypothetical protein [Microvirus sp.]
METTEPVTGHSSGLRALVARDFLLSQRHQEQHWRADRTAADHRILLFEHKFLSRMDKLGVPMFAHCIVRSMAQQTAVYVQGHSKAKAGQSPHNYGLAIDLIHGIRAWDLPKESWDVIGHIGKEVALQNGIKITWGGDFESLYDPAHWELKDWKSIAGRE